MRWRGEMDRVTVVTHIRIDEVERLQTGRPTSYSET